MVPQELFGRNEFPPITDRPYFLSLGPHAFYWFALHPVEEPAASLRIRRGEPPTIHIQSWDEVFVEPVRQALSRMMPAFLRARDWFVGKGRVVRGSEIGEIISFPRSRSYLLLIRVEYFSGDPELYTAPVSLLAGEPDYSNFVLAKLEASDGSWAWLYSAFRDRNFCEEILGAILRRRRHPGLNGYLIGSHTPALRRLLGGDHSNLEPGLAKSNQENTTIFYGDRLALKIFRKVEPGTHPELEIGSLLTQVEFPNAPPLAGSLEYRRPEGYPITLALLSGFVNETSNGWTFTLNHLGVFFERALARSASGPRKEDDSEETAQELIGAYFESMRLLGQRTAELHAALVSEPANPDFAPERFTDFYRSGLYHGILNRCYRMTDELRAALPHLPADAAAEARSLFGKQNEICGSLRFLRDQRLNTMRIRIHGDYRLDQVLDTGRDFMIIDFEGDPRRPLSERRIKRSPLEDVASMLDSCYHAAHGALFGEAPGIIPQPENLDALEAWAKFWFRWVARTFVRAYKDTMEHSPSTAALLPSDQNHFRKLLIMFLLDQSFRGISQALAESPERIRIPAHAILELLERQS
jgi:maltose alpha-D-glucosyltransferase/alpha-amylase